MTREERKRRSKKEEEEIEIEEEKEDEEENEEEEFELDNEKKSIIKKIFLFLIVIVILFLIGYLITRYASNYGIIVREYPVYSNKINDDIHGTKIVQFSDINYNEYRNNIPKMISKINITNTDYVIFTGDLINENYALTEEDKNYLREEFSKINASNKFAIKGENENAAFDEILTNSDFTILETNKVYRLYSSKSYFNLIVLDENSNQDLYLDDEIFNIVVTHNPSNVDNILSHCSPDMIISGHNLNGSIRIPFIKSSKYKDPYYEIGNTKLYVSGGIGNRGHELRLFNNPSINFYRLKKGK